MKDEALLRSGILGLVVAAACCLAPDLTLSVSAAGVSTWLARHDYTLLPALILILTVTAYGLSVAIVTRRTTDANTVDDLLS